MDYLIADGRHVPEGADPYYTEKVIRLPDGYISYHPDRAPDVGPLPFEKNGFISFGGFHNPGKLNNPVMETWAKILKAVPDSRLILKYKDIDSPANHRRIFDQFSAHGIEKARLTLEGPSPHFKLLERYNTVDIALDTFPYSGGLTTCEAIWMGVPVITTPGETFASRHSLSHLMNVGLPELIAGDVPGYVAKAVELAGDIPRLTGLRASLREKIATSNLCNGEKFAADFSQAMRKIWQEWCATRKP